MSIDYSWAKATGERLSAAPRRQLLSSAAARDRRDPARRARMASGHRGDGAARSRRLRWPDPPREGRRAGGARRPLPHVLEHSYRTYLFGLTLAAIDGKGVDEELGTCRPCAPTCIWSTRRPGRCFAVVGASARSASALTMAPTRARRDDRRRDRRAHHPGCVG